MAIEDTLLSIDTTLKALLTIASTFGTASAELGAPATFATSKFALCEGDPDGTRYFLIKKHKTAARILPGDVVPSIDGQEEVDGKTYLEWKATYEKKSATAKTKTEAAGTAPKADTTPPASSSTENVSFEQVVASLMVLSKDPRPGKGRDGLTAFLKSHSVERVPLLAALNKNAELLAEVNALNAPDEAPAEVDPFA